MRAFFESLVGAAKNKEIDEVRLGIASPDKIRSWSYGEVRKPETINYRTFKPERDGLFCCKIFGPEKDYECLCGKKYKMKDHGKSCQKCGVEAVRKTERRSRMGHIKLACPVAHIWFVKSLPSRIALMLDKTQREIERVLYFEAYIVIDPRRTDLEERAVLTPEEYAQKREEQSFRAGIGAEGLREVLKRIDLDDEVTALREQIAKEDKRRRSARGAGSTAKSKKLFKRLKLVEDFRHSQQRPEWMILDTLPVLPPDLRPLVPLDGGRFTTSDLNDLYRRVINRNNRLKRLMDINAPDIIVNNEKRMLQEAVDSLLDNARRGKAATGANKRPLKSLADVVRGKSGRFRQNLLGKRVDFSGRSVIVVGPQLKLHQCGLPKHMAMELFRPFVFNILTRRGAAANIKAAKRMIDADDPQVWDVLAEVIRQHPVLLNRAPTLHRLGIQAFEPVLIEGKAIQLHPLVCVAFNADFDGDQMAVHVPLSLEAQAEARVLMLSSNNLLAPASGEPVITPSQDIVLGLYYMTREQQGAPGEGMRFADTDEVRRALESGAITLHTRIELAVAEPRADDEKEEDEDAPPPRRLVQTTAGRALLSSILPPEVPFEEANKTLKKRDLAELANAVFRRCGAREMVMFSDRLMRLGFVESTRAGVSIGMGDMTIPEEKEKLLAAAGREIAETKKQFDSGLLTPDERYNKSVDLWDKAGEEVTRAMMDRLSNETVMDENKKPVKRPSFNSIYMMADSGARGAPAQIKQLAGMRGLMTKPGGRIIETPIKANFREGLSVLEYFVSTHGARKGLTDTALKTANSGYLTRRLVDVTQDLAITEDDCGADQGLLLRAVLSGGEVVVPLRERILGRTLAKDVKRARSGDTLFAAGEYLTEKEADAIALEGVDEVWVRSPVTCKTRRGLCAKCYGRDLGRGGMIKLGEAVGVVAAQSIGEPGTQLTMRTFHIGGAASRAAAADKIVAGIDGTARFVNIRHVTNSKRELVVVSRGGELAVRDKDGRERERYRIQYGTVLNVQDEAEVRAGDIIATRDTLTSPIIAEFEGRAKFHNITVGVSASEKTDEATGLSALIITESKAGGGRRAKKQPHIRLLDGNDREVKIPGTENPISVLLRPGAILSVRDGDEIKIGDTIAKIPQEAGRSRDITGGLPRVAELFEARIPKDAAVLAGATGHVSMRGIVRNKQTLVIVGERGREYEHVVPKERTLLVQEGTQVKEGELIVDGEADPHEILATRGVEAFAAHIVNEVQEVYRLQGVVINDKHIEVIVHQMLRCVEIQDPGESRFIGGEVVEKSEALDINDDLEPAKKAVAKYRPVLMGITKASLATDSFISAASFQETTRILTESAVAAKRDSLRGLKENVIVGRLVPAGTGFVHHRQRAAREESEAHYEEMQARIAKAYQAEEEAEAAGGADAA